MKIMLLSLIVMFAETRVLSGNYGINRKKCDGVPEDTLAKIMGAAFNSRYMSIDEPTVKEVENDGIGVYAANKRKVNDPLLSFYVDDSYHFEISNKPAWDVSQFYLITSTTSAIEEGHDDSSTSKVIRNSRQISYRKELPYDRKSLVKQQIQRPWECEAKIKWTDLGDNYFPRFLRTVECTKQRCWYGHYECKPKSFTVKLLRRRYGECAQTSDQLSRKTGISGLPGELRELWVWEERAVNFCCDCALP